MWYYVGMGKNTNDQAIAPAIDETVKADTIDVNEATEAANEPTPEVVETPEIAEQAGDLVEVKVLKPFFDLQAETDRKNGDKFLATEARAAELRQVGVVK